MRKSKVSASMGKRILSLFLALLMVLSTFMMTGMSVFAQTRETSDGDDTSYTVTLSADDHGKVSFDEAKGSSKDFDVGDVVKVMLEPEEGYTADAVTASFEEQGIDYTLSVNDDYVAFEMPEEDVQVAATFATISRAASGKLSGAPVDALAYIRDGHTDSAILPYDNGYSLTGYETTGGKPNVSKFWSSGLCCGSFVGYVYGNYCTNVAGLNIPDSLLPSHPQTAANWDSTWKSSSLTKNWGTSFSTDIPVGALVTYSFGSGVTHCAVFAGYYNGTPYIIHVSGHNGAPDPCFATGTVLDPVTNWHGMCEVGASAASVASVSAVNGISLASARSSGDRIVGIYSIKDFTFDAPSTANVSITKTSSNESYTKDNNAYSLDGVKFTLTNTNTKKSIVKTISGKNGGTIQFKDLEEGPYNLEETVQGKNFAKISNISFKVENGAVTNVSKPSNVTFDNSDAKNNNFSFIVPNTPQTVDVQVNKDTYPDLKCLVQDNSAYSLENAHFVLTAKWKSSIKYEFDTDKNGIGDLRNKVPYGTYILKETNAPKGYEIIDGLDKGVEIDLVKGQGTDPSGMDRYSYSTANGKTTVTVHDEPIFDPIAAFLSKDDSEMKQFGDAYKGTPGGGASLAGAEYTVTIFDDPEGAMRNEECLNGVYSDMYAGTLKNIKGGSVGSHTVLAQFVIVTDESGDVVSDKAHIPTDKFWVKHGSYNDWFDDSNVLKYPISTIHVTETKAPTGYERKNVETKVDVKDEIRPYVETSNNSATIHYSSEAKDRFHDLSSFINDGKTLLSTADEILYGGLSVSKKDNQSHESEGQGNAVLAATFNVYNASTHDIKYFDTIIKPNGYVCTITADESNDYVAVTGNTELMYGEYRVVEQTTSNDYNVNPYSVIVNVHPETKAEEGTIYQAINAENPVKRGGVSLTKFTEDFLAARPEGDATLAGAEYTIYNKSKNPVYDPMNGGPYANGDKVVTITTNEKGFASTGAAYLPIGTYVIKETKAPQGYKLNEAWEKEFSVTYEGEVTFYDYIPDRQMNWGDNILSDKMACPDPVIRGGVKIYKSCKDRVTTSPWGDEDKAQGDASLAGATFIVYNRSINPVKVNGQKFKPGQICMSLVTDERGIAQSAADALPYGTYEIFEAGKETAESSPEGYFIDPEWHATVYIREDGKIVDANDYTVNPVLEPIYRGGFKFLKIDAERNEAVPQGDATLEGALFSVINMSKLGVYVDGKWYEPGEICYTFRTDAKGEYMSSDKLLPYGSYRIVETAPSTGYLLNKDYKLDFQITKDGTTYDLTGTPCGEDVIRGDVQIVKNDLELDKSEAIGGKDHGNNEQGTDLNGIKLDIVNRSKELVIVDGVRYKPGEVCKTIVTHWNAEKKAYTAETTGRTLPYGTYDIYEVKSELSTKNDDKANQYYLRSDAVLTFQIREDSKTVTVDTEGNDLIFRDQVIRGDIEFRKIADSTSARMNTAWVVQNMTTGERHVIVADQNGEFYSSADRTPHTTATNENDKFLERIDAGERIKISEFTHRLYSGIWFGLAEDGSVAKADDNLCALPYGQYKISEIPTDTNEGYGLQEFVFYIFENNQVVDLGTVTDDKIEVNTELLDERTKSHFAAARNKTVLNDTITYAGLTIGKEYTARGSLVDLDTNEVVATATRDFTAKTGGKITVVFKFDASALAGHNIVAFEDIIDKSTGYKVGSHADKTDEDQMMSFPKIETTALSDVTGDHDAPAFDKIVITDTVEYTNLIPDKEYTLVGTLMNKTANDNVFNAKGNITATAEFIPDETSGKETVQFTFDATELAGQTVVVFETLKYDGKDIAYHTDIEDTEQTIYIPAIHTTATFEATGTDEGAPMTNAVIEDTVEYKNLLVGKEYTISGVLMDKATGEAIKDADGNEITAKQTFVPSIADGSIAVTFNFDSINMAGKDVVVFETLTRSDVTLAEHKDIDDESQTVHFPEIGTQANYMDTDIQEGLANDKAVITDHVDYKNVKTGGEYTMYGVLMDKATGSPIVDKDGNPIKAETKFTAKETSGTVDVVFEFDATLLAGHTVVAFESLDHNGVEVAIHTDIEDEAQSVKFPKIGTVLTDKETGFDEVMADKDCTFTDTIAYENLTIGHEYVITTVLVDKETGKEVTKAVNTEFTPETENGTFTVDVPVSTKDMANKSIVAYETISYKDIVVAEHKDIEDVDQTVTIPEIGTIAVSTASGDNEGIVSNDYQLTDIVEYKNLVVGRPYTLTGVIMDKETGEPIVGSDGNEITATQGFTASAVNGKVEVQFVFDSVPFAGKDIVVFETLSRDDVVLAEHKDINDENQTIHFPAIDTNAYYGDTTINEGIATDKVTIKDTVTYSNLRAGEEYVVTGTVIDTETGKPVMDTKVDGGVTENEDGSISADVTVEDKFITSEVKFTTKDSDGTVDVTFEFDATALAGKTVTIYESLARGDVERVAHDELDDADQQVHFPEIKTTLTDNETFAHESLARKDMILIDAVECTNLTVGNTYVITGVLMDKTTGEAAKDSAGNEIIATEEFMAENAHELVPLEFKFDGSQMGGMTLVAFETVTRDEYVVAEHKDIEDAEQTVYIPKIGTTAVDKTTGTQMMADDDNVITIVDTVAYENLQVGKSYSLTATVMDKETGKEFVTEDGVPTTGVVAFTPEETNGTVQVEIVLPAMDISGKTFVIFEDLSSDSGTTVAEHKDIDDEAQSVHGLAVDTTATGEDGRSKTIDVSENAVVVDTISYENLVPGKEYSITGTLVYADNSETAKMSNGEAAVVNAKFTPDKPDGAVEVEFTVDTRETNGKSLVVFEKIYDGEVQIGSHEDINDKDQTVTIKTITKLRTGIMDNAAIIAVAMLVVLACAIMFVVYKKRKADRALLDAVNENSRD